MVMPRTYGWEVLLNCNDRWTNDWDGKVHPTIEAARASLAKAADSEWTAAIVELRWVEGDK
jgi:hypothetical protein